MGTALDPIMQIGKGGITEAVVSQLDEALEVRELVKVRVIANSPLDTEAAAEQLAKAVRAETVQIIGRNLLFYRRSEKKPTIELPR